MKNKLCIPVRLWMIVSIVLVSTFSTFAQTNIGGVINHYWPITGISGTQINITSGVGASHILSTNDYVLIIQMKGATINGDGTVGALNQAGSYEFAVVQGVGRNSVTLRAPLLNSYNTNANVQLVWVPTYCDVNVTSTLIASPWDGSVGGILAFIAREITLTQSIDVSGLGFRGGVSIEDNDGVDCEGFGLYNYSDQNGGGAKGEGISLDLGAPFVVGNSVFGRGPYANGGGGGNTYTAGGAGGSNAGFGGGGGKSFYNPAYDCSSSPIGGVHTAPIPSSGSAKLFLGGGGGAGHRGFGDNNVQGGAGGGIIIIKADLLTTVSGQSIAANGVTGYSSLVVKNAGGGGGAGGTILLDIAGYSGTTNTSATGGNGTRVDENGSGEFHGPGGGGSGGSIMFIGGTPTGSTNNTIGGKAGYTTNLDNWGAQAGDYGTVTANNATPFIDFNLPATWCDVTGGMSITPILHGISTTSIYIEILDENNTSYVATWYPYSGTGTINLVSVAQTYGTPLVCGHTYTVTLAVSFGCSSFKRTHQTIVYCPPNYNTTANIQMVCPDRGTASITAIPTADYGPTTINIWYLLKLVGSSYTFVASTTSPNGANGVFNGLTTTDHYMVVHTIQDNSILFCNQASYFTAYVSCVHKRDETGDLTNDQISSLLTQQPIAIEQQTGLEKEVGITLFPNPTKDKVTVELNSATDSKMTLSVIDVTGRTVLANPIGVAQGINDNELDVSHLAPGMYLVLVKAENGIVAKSQFIKQ